jgi:hypothetical protein
MNASHNSKRQEPIVTEVRNSLAAHRLDLSVLGPATIDGFLPGPNRCIISGRDEQVTFQLVSIARER